MKGGLKSDIEFKRGLEGCTTACCITCKADRTAGPINRLCSLSHRCLHSEQVPCLDRLWRWSLRLRLSFAIDLQDTPHRATLALAEVRQDVHGDRHSVVRYLGSSSETNVVDYDVVWNFEQESKK